MIEGRIRLALLRLDALRQSFKTLSYAAARESMSEIILAIDPGFYKCRAHIGPQGRTGNYEKMNEPEIRQRMTFNPPNAERAEKHERIGEILIRASIDIAKICPMGSRGLALALTKLEEAKMWANQALATAPSEQNLQGLSVSAESRDRDREETQEAS